jgi:hypothetical protein
VIQGLTSDLRVARSLCSRDLLAKVANNVFTDVETVSSCRHAMSHSCRHAMSHSCVAWPRAIGSPGTVAALLY